MSSVARNHRQRPVTVIGAGTLGRRIALMFACGTVRITDPHAETGAAAVAFVREQLPAVAAKVTDGSPGTVGYESDQATAVAGAWLVVEAVSARRTAHTAAQVCRRGQARREDRRGLLRRPPEEVGHRP